MRLAIVHDDHPAATLAVGDEDAPPAPDDAAPGDDTADEPAEQETEAEMGDGEHEWVLVVEGVETGDGRIIEKGGLTWRDLPLPLMATDVTDDGHDGAKLVGQITEIYRDPTDEARVLGKTRKIKSDDAEVKRLQQLIDDGELRGISVDMDQLDAELEITVTPIDEDAEPELNDDGDEVVKLPMGGEKLRIRKARIMGATAVPFPAFAEAKLIASADALVATAVTPQPADADEFPITAPVAPPAHWFDDPGFTKPTPMSVEADGYVRGHIALWNSCHRGFDTCTPPPRAPGGSYAQFHTGEIVTAEGTRLAVGNITVDAGHAPLDRSALGAREHYDHTGWIGADGRCGEDQFGIWFAGALRPELPPTKIRALLAADVSGDWRRIDNALQLIGLASVPVPGFVKTRVAAAHVEALVASVPVCEADDPADVEYADMAEFIAASIGRDGATLTGERDAVAFAIGRHPAQRAAARLDLHRALAASIAAEVR